MSGISLSRRWLSTAVCTALLASTVTIGTATAQSSSNGSLALSSGSSAGSSAGSQSCTAVGNGDCEVDNGSVQAAVDGLIGQDAVTTELTITGLRDTSEDISVAYSAEGLENVEATSTDDKVSITRDGDVFSATVAGGLDEGEYVTVSIDADLIEDHEGPRTQSLSLVSATQATDALNAVPGVVFAALGVYALIEHAHNMHWIPREVDQLLYRLTGRDPELSRIQWSLFQ